MHLLMVVVALAADPVRVATLKTQTANLEPKTAEALAVQWVQQLALQPALHVVTPDDIATLLGLERQRELLGCASDSCTAELAGALGVDVVVQSSVALVGKSYVLNAKALEARSGEPLSIISERVDTVDALLDSMPVAARRIAADVTQRLRAQAPASGVSASTRRPMLPFVSIAAGGAVALVGGILFGLSKVLAGQATAGTVSDIGGAISIGRSEETAGLAMLSVGLAVLAAGIVWALLAGPPAAEATQVSAR